MQKRQFVTDEAGKPVAVILPLEEYDRVRHFLEENQLEENQSDEDKLQLMQEAASDDAFLSDLEQSLEAFKHVDGEWWEPTE